ncbi:hypothetical protein [Nocardiopsis algeriensis]|uniref:Uncharacterized protein n=1 Tax=Nocardiopsis algeriensis TaxID=1478215 RepID=A0A841IRV0_9ACTN|nr:hypothetical protein [Nocardiopsis algeriensis]MBB6119011.1 hypothetical protein [Nocardiopsis algeriensis]
MDQHPTPGQGEPWQQPHDPGAAHWDAPPQQGYGNSLEPHGGYVPMQPDAPHEAVLCTIGDIAFTQTTVITPGGRFPLKGSVWTVTDMSRTERSTPVWAIVVAILVFWWTCLLGLLFLLVKEQRTSGHVQVTVQNHGHYHATSVPASYPGLAEQINQQVNYARSLAA